MARHRTASHVIEKALLHGEAKERAALREELERSTEALNILTKSNYGSFVGRERAVSFTSRTSVCNDEC